MSNRTPSKKVVYTLIASILAVSLISFAKFYTPHPSEQITLNTATSTDSEESNAFDEYLAKLPQASSTPLFNIATSTKYIPSEPDNMTGSFAKDFFGKYLSAQSGGAMDQNVQDSLLESLTSQYISAAAAQNHFSAKDVMAVSSLDEENIRQYANDFVSIEEKGNIEAEIYTKRAESDPQNITLAGIRYKKIANDLMQMNVPAAISESHLGIANSYYKLGDAMAQMEGSVSDPIKTLFLVKQIQESTSDKDVDYFNIATFVKNSGIIFSDNEPGRYFLVIANQQ